MSDGSGTLRSSETTHASGGGQEPRGQIEKCHHIQTVRRYAAPLSYCGGRFSDRVDILAGGDIQNKTLDIGQKTYLRAP